MRFVHTADWQLGMTRRFLGAPARPVPSGPTGEAQSRFAAARLDAVRALGALADAEGAAFVLVCGDMFESNLVGPDVVARACEALRSFSTPALLLPGNHDPADAASVLRRPDFARRCPDHVTVLDTPGIHRVAEGVEVLAAPWSSKHPLTDPVGGALGDLERQGDLERVPAGTVRVVAGHGRLDVLTPEPTEPDLVRYDTLRAAVDGGRAHYVALGDRHSTWSDGTGRVRYAGSPEVTAHDEVDSGNVLVVDLTDRDVAVRAVRVGRWRFTAHDAAVDTEADQEALDTWLTACDDKERTAVRLGLEGTLTLSGRARLDALIEAHVPAFAAVEISETRSRLVTLPDDADLAGLELSGFAAAAAAELYASAGAQGDRDDQGESRDALGLLHRLVTAPGRPP